MDIELTIEEVKKFFDERPALGMNGISMEAGIAGGHLSKILRGERTFSPSVTEKLLPIMIKYGYKKK